MSFKVPDAEPLASFTAGSFSEGRPSNAGLLPQPKRLPHQTSNLIIFATMYAIYMGLSSGVMEVAPLASSEIFTLMGVSPAWYEPATLPFFAIMFAELVLAVPNSWMVNKVGKRRSFFLGGVVAAVGLCVGGWALLACEQTPSLLNFWLLVLSGLFVGPISVAEFLRFVATEACPPEQEARAIALTVSGGAICSIVGPLTAWFSSELANAAGGSVLQGYAVFYFAAAGLSLIFACLSLCIRLPKPEVTPDVPEPGPSAQRPVVTPAQALPLATTAPMAGSVVTRTPLFRRPGILAAFMGSCGAQWMMLSIMSATPLAMQHSLDVKGAGWQVSTVFATHLLGMFVPGLFSGHLIARYGPKYAMVLGWSLFAFAVGAAALPAYFEMDDSIRLVTFYISLIPLGVGWHFSFVGASKLLLEHHDASEKAKAQGVNEMCRFAANAAAIWCAGVVDWKAISTMGAPILGLLVASVLLLLWHA